MAEPRCRSTSPCRSRRAGRATSALARTAIVHLTPGLDGVSRAVNEAQRGLLPAEATVVVGQPLTIDPSRAPEGKGILWIQLQELPWRIKGDAAGEIDVGDGSVDGRAARALRRPDPGAPRAAPARARLDDPEARRARAARPGAAEHQPAPRRPVRRRALARPELPLASVLAQPGPCDLRRPALAHRRKHVARPGPRRRLRHARRAGAAEAAGTRACPRQAARAETELVEVHACHALRDCTSKMVELSAILPR